MFNSSVVDVAIGLIFVYLILGLVCTTVNEWVAQWFKLRSQTLKEGIRRLLNAPPDGTYLIRTEDLNAAKLVERIGKSGDPLAGIIGPLNPSEQQLVDAYRTGLTANASAAPSDELLQMLTAKLNDALKRPDLHEQINKAKVTPETLAEAQKPLKPNDLLRVNHALLHQAFPDEIAGLAETFYGHPLIKSLTKPGNHPSYVPAETFALAMTDILRKGGAAQDFVQIKASIERLPDSDVRRSLLALANHAEGTTLEVDKRMQVFQKSLESWFDNAMDRVSGWYKRKSQVITVIVAALIVVFANADSVLVARKLFVNPVLRQKIAQDASSSRATLARQLNIEYTDPTNPIPTQPVVGAPSKVDTDSVGLTAQEKSDLGELTGWSEEFKTFHRMQAVRDNSPEANPNQADRAAKIEAAGKDDRFPGLALQPLNPIFWSWLWTIVPTHLLGWILTAIAVSLGAPFWFDTLNKFMNIRSAGTAPNEKKQDKSKV